jgi:ligand-binding sensor domain-containing protein
MKIKRPFIDLFLIIPFILYGQYIYSQDYILEPATSFEKLELPGGSLGNSVQCMVQDSFGFMWYASKNGLHRWDGYQFKTYQHDPDDSTSISGNHVEHICLAKDGTLWIAVGWGTNKGLLEHFDQRTETFTHYDYQPELKINSEAYNLATIIEDHDGDIWTGTHYGVYKLDIKNGTFKQYLHDPDDSTSISHNITRSIFKDSKGVLWFGTGLFWDQSPDGGLNRYRPETDDFVRYYHDPNDVNSLKSNIISALSEDSNGNFWVGTTHGGLHKMNREMGTFQRITEPVFSSFKSSITISKAISNTFIQYIYEDLKKQLWVGYFNGGLLNYNPVTGTKQLFEADKSKPGSLPEKYLWSIYGSRDGTLWGSTTGPESVVYKIKQSDFNSYKLASSTNFVGALCESQDQSIWVGTHEEGLSKLDLKASKVIPIELKTIRSSNSTKVYDSQLVDKNEILKKPIKIVEENAGGGLWIIKDLYPGMIYFNPQNNVAKTYGYDPNDKKSISEGIFTDILKDDQGDVWFVSSTGDLNVYDNETDGFSKFKYSSSVEEEVGLNYNCQLTNSSNGRIIIAGTGANPGQLPILLKYFNPETKEFIEVDISLANSELDLIDREITGLIEDRNGNIWICNHSHLININPSSGDVNILSAKIFNTDYFKGMAMDDHGRIWMVGENISFFDPLSTELSIRSVSSNTVKNFPGFKQTIINSSDGLIYIGGEGSFICFSPDRILSNKSNIPPQSIISDFQLLDQADDNQNSTNFKLYLNENISLNHHQNTFSIRFATLDFNNPQQNRIRYKLDGLDDQWRTAGLDPVATYIKIPPGDYTFQVKGATAFSEWGSSQEMGIQISPPLWATWWAYTLYGILILGFLYLLNKFQLKRKLEKSETVRLKEIDIAKNRLFTNISHEFRTPLTVISGMSSHIKVEPRKVVG